MVAFFLLLLVAIYADNGTQNACTCSCCPDLTDPTSCGVYGSYPISSCDKCTSDDVSVQCPILFPDACAGYAYTTDCGIYGADDTNDWEGDWVVDPCSACLLDVHGTPVGDCLPCCDPANGCDCIYGTVTINSLGTTLLADGSNITQIEVKTTATSSHESSNVGNETGFLGNTATVIVTDIYDLIKHGDHLQLNNRKNAQCNIQVTRNPPQTSLLKLGLLLGGVGIVVIALVVFCCCNPCKSKKKDAKLLDEEGQQEGVPNQTTPDVGAINYTGGKSNPSDL